VKDTEILQDTSNSDIRFRAHTKNVNHDWAYALSGIVLALMLFVLGKRFKRTTSVLYALILLALGVLGSILLFMMTFSDMDMTWFNENIVLVNPLLFIGMGSAFVSAFTKKTSRKGVLAKRTFQAMFVVGIALVVAKGLLPNLLMQDNLKVILLLLPLSLSGATFYGRSNRKEL